MALALAIAIIVFQRYRCKQVTGKLEQRIEEILNAPADTVVMRDTITITEFREVVRWRTQEIVSLPDTLVVYDTVLQMYQLPREAVAYKGDDYRAVVSGVQPRLDSLSVYPQKVEITKIVREVERKKTRWGIGPHVSVGYNGKKVQPFVGLGVQYNIITW